MTSSATGFAWPFFYSYPPYFTLQLTKETRDKQLTLWCQLILTFCRHHKLFVLGAHDDCPLWSNSTIDRKLNAEARQLFLEALAAAGQAEWLDKSRRQALILWKSVPEWAATLTTFISTYGLGDSVMTLDELSGGDDVRGTELQGMHRELQLRVMRLLEAQGKVRMFKGATPEEEGVKFL